MNLSLVGIADRGVPNKERVHILALQPSDLAMYAVMHSVKPQQAAVAAGGRLAFWFTNTIVNPGDNVILYTGQGLKLSALRPDGGSDHFFFWGLPNTVFNDPRACAVLAEFTGYEVKQ